MLTGGHQSSKSTTSRLTMAERDTMSWAIREARATCAGACSWNGCSCLLSPAERRRDRQVRYSSLGYQSVPRPSGVVSRMVQIGIRSGRRAGPGGIGGSSAHLTAPKMADRAIAAAKDVVCRNIRVLGADIVPRVVAADVSEEVEVLPAALALERGEALYRRRATTASATRWSMSRASPSHALRSEVHIGQGRSRCGPNM